MKTRIVSKSVTRPTNTDGYTANDVIGTVMAFEGLANFREGGALIQSAALISSQNAATKLDADLLLFSSSVTAAADNAAFVPTDAQMETLVGVISFPTASGKAGHAGAAAAGNAFCSVANLGIAAPTELYGVLIARNAYAPVADEKITINLGVIQNQVS
jgi:hypothetical protein